jgi:type I restriction enzyme M protein
MQTNREDVGKRYLEIEIPVPPNAKRASEVSAAFRDYFQSIAAARTSLQQYLSKSMPPHHFFVSGAEPIANADTGDDEVLEDKTEASEDEDGD